MRCLNLEPAMAVQLSSTASDDSPSPPTSFFGSSRGHCWGARADGAPHQCPLESVASYFCHFMLTCTISTTHRHARPSKVSVPFFFFGCLSFFLKETQSGEWWEEGVGGLKFIWQSIAKRITLETLCFFFLFIPILLFLSFFFKKWKCCVT